MSIVSCFAGGLVGSTVLTAIHETGRRTIAVAPRMDVVGMRALVGSLRAADITPPPRPQLHRWTLAGDLVTNAAYYGLAGLGPRSGLWARATALGLVAGIGALLLPRRLGLGDPPHSGSPINQVLTVSYYLAGALAAAAAMQIMNREEPEEEHPLFV